jgi:predicted transcriptional regulator
MVAKTLVGGDPTLTELTAIKRLMMLALLKSGVTQKEIAVALGVDQSQVSRMLPGLAQRQKG